VSDAMNAKERDTKKVGKIYMGPLKGGTSGASLVEVWYISPATGRGRGVSESG